MLKNTLGVDIDGPTWRGWQSVKQSLDARRIGAEDELPLMLTGDAMREGGRGTHQVDFDIPIPGMARQRVGKLVRFDRALLVGRTPDDVPHQPREWRVAMLAAKQHLLFEKRIEVML